MGTHIIEEQLHEDHFEKDSNGKWTVTSSGGGAVAEVVTASKTITNDGGHYFVDLTTNSTITLTIDSALTYFFVYDSEGLAGSGNMITVSDGTNSHNIENYGSVFVFYKQGSAWKYRDLGNTSGGSV